MNEESLMDDVYELKVNPRFEALLPGLTAEELSALTESILKDGCRDAITTWDMTIVDGHNRYRICQKHGITFKVREVSFADEDEAMDWIDKNQMARRNLTPDEFQLALGRRYNRTKKAAHDGGKGEGRSGGQNDHHLKTAEAIASEHGVSEKTVRRAGKFAAEVEAKPELQKLIKDHKPVNKAKRELKKANVIAQLEDVKAQEAKAVEGVYDTIVIDPPWPIQKIERDCRPNQVVLDYPTMTVDDIGKLRIPCAPDCHVWLWTTPRFLPDSFGILDSWGLKYVCCFVWHKPGGYQPIGLPQYNCEYVLYARAGSPVFTDTKAFNLCFDAPRGKHSEKPEAFYDTIRRVTAGRRLDMFGRRAIVGFDSWGKEAV